MITYINRANANKYRILFDKANAELDLKGENEINSIEQYFRVIKSLVERNGNRKFTILPLDEEVFEIDANKRLITIPPSFKTNGISVQGDHIAEIIYFKIDRFFDATDLNEMDIYIQWQTPDGPKGQKGAQGISREWVRDVESEPGKLIFGWPLSEEITERSGNVKFAVRFVKFGETEEDKNTIYYSFSTLTAEAQVKSALDFDLTEDIRDNVIDYSKDILGRLVNSTAPLPNTGESDPPYILLDLKDKAIVDLENGQRALHVQAVPTDAGRITYRWRFYGYKKDEDGNYVMDQVSEESIFDTKANKPIVTQDATPVAGKIYYLITFKPDTEEVEIATPLDFGINADKEIFENHANQVEGAVKVYEFVSEFIAKEVGKYTVQIVNRRGLAADSMIPQKETDQDYADANLMAIVPLPAAPTITGLFVDDGDVAIEKIVIRDPNHPDLILDGEEEPLPESITLSGLASANPGDSITYKWFKNNEEIISNETVVPEIEITETDEKNGAWYYLEGTSSRNNVSMSKMSKGCFVSYPPLNPEINGNAPTMAWLGTPISGSSYIVNNTGRADSYVYKWYSYKTGQKGELLAEGPEFIPTELFDICVEVFSCYNGRTLKEGVVSFPIDVFSSEV